MHSISSRYRKPKGRPNKRKRIGLQNYLMKNSTSEEICNDESSKREAILNDLVPSTSSNNPVHSDSMPPITNDYLLINKDVWMTLLKDIPCSDCKKCSLDVLQENSFGFSTKIKLVCKTCEKSYGHTFTSDREQFSRKFDVNTKLASAFLAIGRGHAALETFASILGTACMDKKTFSKCLENVWQRNETSKIEMLRLSHENIRKAYLEADQTISHDDILDISVSYDGTWHKRGHTSHYGIGIVIDIMTNLVVDFEVLSKYCPECTLTAKSLGELSPEFFIWKSGHAENCQKNFDGSSASMEMNAASILWKRSIAECKMRYTTILCDGDAKTYQHLNKEKVYGDNITIQKEECVNHVSKRLGTALRNKVKEWRQKGVTLGGKKRGNLTDATITKLQNFYRKAIVDNAPDVPKMKSAILATLFHCMSSDSKPMHTKCPEGEFSWCFYNRAKAKKETPIKQKLKKTQLSEEIVSKIMPVYQRLASDEILSRCISAKTQNANESLHSCIWRKCPKDVFVSKRRIDIAVTAAVSEMNIGYVETLKLSHSLDNSFTIAERRDNRRLSQCNRKSAEQYKKDKNLKNIKNKL